MSFRTDQAHGHVWSYVPAFVLCMMFALAFTSYRVAFRIIKFVFETLTGKTIIDKPTVKFQQDCFRRLGVLCDLQVCLALADERTRTITVLHDGTSKKGQQYAGVQLQLFDGRVLSLGIQAVSDGTAATLFNSFHRRLEQILRTKTGRKSALPKEVAELYLKLLNSMSDRCKVEIKWAQLLEEKKMALISQEFGDLSSEEQKRLAKVYRFFCFAHALSGMTAVLEKLFKLDRKANPARALYNNTCFNAMREISKSFHPESKWGFQLF